MAASATRPISLKGLHAFFVGMRAESSFKWADVWLLIDAADADTLMPPPGLTFAQIRIQQCQFSRLLDQAIQEDRLDIVAKLASAVYGHPGAFLNGLSYRCTVQSLGEAMANALHRSRVPLLDALCSGIRAAKHEEQEGTRGHEPRDIVAVTVAHTLHALQARPDRPLSTMLELCQPVLDIVTDISTPERRTRNMREALQSLLWVSCTYGSLDLAHHCFEQARTLGVQVDGTICVYNLNDFNYLATANGRSPCGLDLAAKHGHNDVFLCLLQHLKSGSPVAPYIVRRVLRRSVGRAMRQDPEHGAAKCVVFALDYARHLIHELAPIIARVCCRERRCAWAFAVMEAAREFPAVHEAVCSCLRELAQRPPIDFKDRKRQFRGFGWAPLAWERSPTDGAPCLTTPAIMGMFVPCVFCEMRHQTPQQLAGLLSVLASHEASVRPIAAALGWAPAVRDDVGSEWRSLRVWEGVGQVPCSEQCLRRVPVAVRPPGKCTWGEVTGGNALAVVHYLLASGGWHPYEQLIAATLAAVVRQHAGQLEALLAAVADTRPGGLSAHSRRIVHVLPRRRQVRGAEARAAALETLRGLVSPAAWQLRRAMVLQRVASRSE